MITTEIRRRETPPFHPGRQPYHTFHWLSEYRSQPCCHNISDARTIFQMLVYPERVLQLEDHCFALLRSKLSRDHAPDGVVSNWSQEHVHGFV